MTSRDFCFWLQGYFEIGAQSGVQAPALTGEQMATVRRHLALVFKYEIDPGFGDKAEQEKLNAIHAVQTGTIPNAPQFRC